MQCPNCGYMLTAFDILCPRCRSRREAGAPPPTALPVHMGPARDTPDPDQRVVFQAAPPPPQAGKICPACSTIAQLTASYCLRCGRQYQTVFLPPQYPPPPPPAPYRGQPYQGQPPTPHPPYPPPYPYRSDVIQMPPGTHSVAAAVILALLIIGTGQMVNRQATKGVTILLSSIVLGVVTLGAAWFVISIVALIDAVCIANRLNRGEPVGPWQWF